MRKRHILAVVLGGLVILALWWFLSGKPSTALRRPAPEGNVAVTNLTQERRMFKTAEEKLGQTYHQLAGVANVPIEFYGKVVDQNKVSIPGVAVKGGVGMITGDFDLKRLYVTRSGFKSRPPQWK